MKMAWTSILQKSREDVEAVINIEKYQEKLKEYISKNKKNFPQEMATLEKYSKSLETVDNTTFLNTLLEAVYEVMATLEKEKKIRTPKSFITASEIFTEKESSPSQVYLKGLNNILVLLEKMEKNPESNLLLNDLAKIPLIVSFLDEVYDDSKKVFYYDYPKLERLTSKTTPYSRSANKKRYDELEKIGKAMNKLMGTKMEDTALWPYIRNRLDEEKNLKEAQKKFMEGAIQEQQRLTGQTYGEELNTTKLINKLPAIIDRVKEQNAVGIGQLLPEVFEEKVGEQEILIQEIHNILQEEHKELYEEVLDSNMDELEELVLEEDLLKVETPELEKQDLKKEFSPILDTLDDKKRKRLKKTLQSVEPTEYFGQDFTRLGELIDMLKELDLIKSDDKMKKRFESIDERNIDMVALSSRLRKEYELLYRQLREVVYPRRKGDLRDE